ncbi:histidine protein methyltransferase 1 homolog isoform X1 [Ostrea edulis]|uniref:histidine protein methyltransferase 1 homolog isoform X1 n=1 Tax=Ostrea edulis TaxID=37623 RepID=UPI0024AF439C|nr:histidine protein methyltransferase 1 homolog isoform X1 [Ostrea edulis]
MWICLRFVMEFKFNFFDPQDLVTKTEETEDNYHSPIEANTQRLEQFQELFPDKFDHHQYSKFRQNNYNFSKVNINCYRSEDIEKWIVIKNSEASVVKTAAESHSDLVPNVYEGGLTIWECGCDLAEFITDGNIDFKQKSVLELGCGAGLPGICAMKLGADQVHFQDYNSEVISHFTIPNVLELNNRPSCQCRFFSGDWEEFQKHSTITYDYILTAETIYNSENYPKLHKLLQHLLKDDGRILVAAKSNYYGVGGGTGLFEDFVQKEGYFSYTCVKTIEAGVPREIVMLEKSQGEQL